MSVSVEKVSMALGLPELSWARDRAEREGGSLSAVVTRVLREARARDEEQARRDEAWAEVVAWATDGKGFSDDDLAEARRELDAVGL